MGWEGGARAGGSETEGERGEGEEGGSGMEGGRERAGGGSDLGERAGGRSGREAAPGSPPRGRDGGGRCLQPQGAIAAGRGGGCGRGRGRAIREPATLPAFRHLVRKCALVHISVREAAGREGLILTHQNRVCHWFGSKMASQNGFCGVLPAFHHLNGKRAVVHSSVREAAKRKGLMLSDVNLDYERFAGKMAAPK